MLRIGKDQLAAMEATMKNKEPDWAVGLLKKRHAAWCAERSPEDIRRFCTDTLDFAHRCDFKARPSLQCLLELRVTDRLPSPFSDWQKALLTRKGFSEETRLAQFMETLSGTDQTLLISLHTDLSAIRP